jgi:hypothetical protein
MAPVASLADQGSDEEPGRQPRRGDPEEPELYVPRPHQAVRQQSGQRDAVEAIPFYAVVRDDAPGHDLHQEERGHHDKVLHGGALRRRRAQADERVAAGRGLERRRSGHGGVEPDDEADASQEQEDAHLRPHDSLAGRDVGDQRLVGPVARVGDGVAGARGR